MARFNVSGSEILKELMQWGISSEVEDWHVKLSGGQVEVREYYEQFLHGNVDAEAFLILELSKTDEELRYAIEERAAIRETEGLAADLLSAIKVCQR